MHVIHMRALMPAVDHGLKLTKVHKVIEFKQEAWLNPYINMNTMLRTNTTNDFFKDFFKLKNNTVFGKTIENVGKHRDIKIVTTNKQWNKFASEPNYLTIKYISEDLLIMETKKAEVKMNKPIYLVQARLDISKTLMYEFWHDYIKPKYGNKVKLCYMDTNCFIMHIETEDFYKDIADGVNKRFDSSNYDKNDNRPLPIGINKKVIDMFKDELGRKIITEFCALRAKTYAYLMEDGSEHKKA